jgi:hypothetical protein
MGPSNKILTVTYGTFSCTLEGFDDPFTAMTEIAEYFRDLAAQDRFFGAEPPTPDMTHLRRIAEARQAGPVEAEGDGSHVVLRPSAAPGPASVVTPAATNPAAPVRAAAAPLSGATLFGLGAPVQPALRPEAPSDMASTSLETARDADASEMDEASTVPSEAAFDAVTDTDVALDAASVAGGSDTEEHAPDDATMPVEAGAPDEVEEPVLSQDVTAAEDAVGAFALAEGSVEGEPGDESVAQAEDADAEDDAAEDDAIVAASTAPTEEEATATLEAEQLPALVAAEDAPAELHEDASAEAVVAEEDGTAEMAEQSAMKIVADQEDLAGEHTEVETDDLDEGAVLRGDAAAHASEIDAIAAALASLELSEPVSAEAEADDRDEEVAIDLSALFSPIEDAEKAQTESTPEEDAAADAPELDLMAELAAIEAELSPGASPDAAAPSESKEPEDHLSHELAAIQADEAAAPTSVEAQTPAHDEEGVEAVVTEAVATEAETPETAMPQDMPERGGTEDLERLFAATDSRLSGEAAARRRANIAHLKAAVTARRADDTIKVPDQPDAAEAYREDLALTVKPQAASPETDEAAPAAPLVLVSEHRVLDAPEAARESAAEPRPSEPAARKSRIADTAEDFEQFAEEVGAVDLIEVLEAAAVYSTTVMGQQSFSRPRLLHLAAEAVDDLSREDGLRGFGQLLREGTLRKVDRGTFTLGAASRFQSTAEKRVG